MRKNKLKNIAGLTLVEMLISLIISSVMMAAMYTTYNIVNKTYSQVADRAKISSSGRDIVEMLMRDIRMAGFKFYRGKNDDGVPEQDYLQFITGKKYNAVTESYENISIAESHDPIIIVKDYLGNDITSKAKWSAGDTGAQPDLCCDKIIIVYGDYNQNTPNQPYKKYRITYYAKPIPDLADRTVVTVGEDRRYAVFKTKESWIQKLLPEKATGGSWVQDGADCPECYVDQKIRDHIVDMEFIPFNQDGKALLPVPSPDKSTAVDLYNIRSVDVRLTFRSHKKYFQNDAKPGQERFVAGLGDRKKVYDSDDKYLRDSVVVTVHTRNIGSGI